MEKKGFFNNKSFKYGSYAFIMTAIVIAVIVFVNIILSVSLVSKALRFDITKEKMFSISQQSIDFVKTMSKDVDIYVMAPENQFVDLTITEAFNQYVLKSNGKIIDPKYIDLDKDPTFISKNLDPDQVQGIQTGDVVIKSGKNIKVLSYTDFYNITYDSYGNPQLTGIKVEEALTSAIKSVTSDTVSNIYFVSGHGEIGNDQISQLRSVISLNNYELKDITLTTPIPEEVNMLMFASPTGDLLQGEMDNLLAYMEKGGSAIFLFDVQQDTKELPNFNEVFNRYYLALNNDQVYEFSQQNYLQDNRMIRPMVYKNDVTQNLNPDQLFVYLPGSRSVSVTTPAKDQLKNYPLFGTTDNSSSIDMVTQEEKTGPFCLGALGQTEVGISDYSRIAVIGNSSFITDAAMAKFGDNGSRYIISIMNWMQNSNDSILIPTKPTDLPPLNLTEQSRLVIFILLIAVVPLLIIGFGVFVWIRRKNL